MLPLGHEIGPYVLEAVAGQGGMGVVYRARDTLLGRSAALKILRRDVAEDADSLPRFLREARIAAELRHPAIPAVYEVSIDSETPYLALEWVEGTTLRTCLLRGSLTSPDRLRILRTVAEVLAFAHEHGVIHRDVKPGNVMVDAQGFVRLLDFGIAKHSAGAGRHSPLTFDTSDTSILGTPRYMAPEQMLGGTAVDARVDQFGWAAMAYELLTGRPAAFSMRDPGETFPFARPIPCRERALDVDGRKLAPVVDKALSPTAEDRYPSMRALLQAWDRATSTPGPPSPTGRRGVFVIAAAVTVGLGAVSTAVVFGRPLPASKPPPPPSASAPAPTVDRDAVRAAEVDAEANSAPTADAEAKATRTEASPWAPDRGGRCRCLQDVADPRILGPALCPAWAFAGAYGLCKPEGVDSTRVPLCHDPVTVDNDTSCANNRYPATEGAPCRGYAASFDGPRIEDGNVRAEIECKDLFAYSRSARGVCRGLTRTRQLVTGIVVCPK